MTVRRIVKRFIKFKTNSIAIWSEFSKSTKLHKKSKIYFTAHLIILQNFHHLNFTFHIKFTVQVKFHNSNQISPEFHFAIQFNLIQIALNLRQISEWAESHPTTNKQTYRTASLTCGQKINSVVSSFKISNLLFWMLE